ncbi:50S ribosomal protein L18 [Candidatus Micrarchaeota archaeon]|nr:50S ribosomal protein L18 [Candidatus Micrarchaeota archaeon]
MTRAKGPAFTVAFRRRRDGKTNFAKRLALVKSGLPRMVVRRSNKNLLVQFVTFDPKGDKTLLSFDGFHLAKNHKWISKRNVWTAYLVGLAAGKMAQKKGVKDFVFDMGLYTPSKGSVVFAALKGAVDSGLTSTSMSEEKVPTEKLSNPPEALKASFEDVKKKLSSG